MLKSDNTKYGTDCDGILLFYPLEYHLGITFKLFVIEFSSVAQ